MSKLFSFVFIILVGGSLYALLRASNSQSDIPVREIPVATAGDEAASNRAPASVSSFNINEELLTRLESNREHLAEYAHAEPSAGGWRIHLVSGEPLFAKSGFYEGQFISFEMLKSVSEESHQPELADRMVDVLRSIEQ